MKHKLTGYAVAFAMSAIAGAIVGCGMTFLIGNAGIGGIFGGAVFGLSMQCMLFGKES